MDLSKKDEFSIFVSNLPYSKSKDAIEWLSTKFFFSWSNNGSKRICRKTYLQHQKIEKLLV